ncbi:MAG TPA: response regulator [Bryobacteraceae bacterium]|jgi:DNA-binding response OmpR family regulator
MIHNRATVMVFHSAPVVRTVIREILEREGYLVRATGDLGNAVDMVRESPPDLLLIGVSAGHVNGHDAAVYLRGKCPSMRVLMLAGLPADERVEIWTRGEGFSVFPQPFAPAELTACVKELLAQSRPAQRRAATHQTSY